MSRETKRLALGTVQLGLDYGATNHQGRPNEAQAAAIIEMALAAGIDTIDTAAAYGMAESLLGKILPPEAPVRIVTKVGSVREGQAQPLGDAVSRSLERLRRPALDAVLLHGTATLVDADAARIVDELRALRDDGLARQIGVSVDGVEELERACGMLDLDLVQLPLNVFDQRFLKSGWLDRLAQKASEIHVRSVFLQGVLIAPLDALPPYFAPVAKCLNDFDRDMRELGTDRMTGCLAFALQQKSISRVVVGVNNCHEFAEVLSAAERAGRFEFNFATYSIKDEEMLAPWRWPPREQLIA